MRVERKITADVRENPEGVDRGSSICRMLDGDRDQQRCRDAIIGDALSKRPQRLTHRGQLRWGEKYVCEMGRSVCGRSRPLHRPGRYVAFIHESDEQGGTQIGCFKMDVAHCSSAVSRESG